MMIQDFDDFSLWVYYLVDVFVRQLAPFLRRPGPPPTSCSDSELIAMAIIGECRGLDGETELLSFWKDHRDLFPHQPDQSRFNRRRRNLMPVFNLIRQAILRVLDVAQDPSCVIDSLPVPVVNFHLVPQSQADWAEHGAAFGKVSSKKQTIYGYKLHLLLTARGVILDFVLAPANAADLAVGEELLEAHTDLTVLGDKAYISAAVQAALREARRIRLLSIPRRNQRTQLPAAVRAAINGARQIIETVNDQLTEQFNVERNHAHTFWGLCTRLYTKLTAHTLCIYINRLLGRADFLQIKRLAFPN
jgi:IS5 family transposase